MVLAGNKTHCQHCSVFSTATRFKARANSKITRGKNYHTKLIIINTLGRGPQTGRQKETNSRNKNIKSQTKYVQTAKTQIDHYIA